MPIPRGDTTSSNKLLKTLGANELEIHRVRGLKKLGLTESDMEKASALFEEQRREVESENPIPKTSNLTGYSEAQINRDKAVTRVLGVSEDEISQKRAKDLASLGTASSHVDISHLH